MLEEIKNILSKNGISRLNLSYLIDLGNDIDDDEDEIPIVADTIELVGNDVYVYDSRDEDEDGVIDPYWKLSELDEKVWKDTLFNIKKTLNLENPD